MRANLHLFSVDELDLASRTEVRRDTTRLGADLVAPDCDEPALLIEDHVVAEVGEQIRGGEPGAVSDARWCLLALLDHLEPARAPGPVAR